MLQPYGVQIYPQGSQALGTTNRPWGRDEFDLDSVVELPWYDGTPLELLGLYRLETQMTSGNGQLKLSGLSSNTAAKESVKVGFDYFRANATQIQASAKPGDHDYHLHVVEAHNTGPSIMLTLSAYVALCSALVGKPIESQMVVLGSMSLGGNIVPVENLAESLQVASEAGAKRLLLPMASVGDIPTIPGELFAKFQTSFYSDPKDAVFKAFGVR